MSEEFPGLDTLTTKQLRAIAKEKGIPYKFKFTKAQLVRAIEDWFEDDIEKVEEKEYEIKTEEVVVDAPPEEELPPMSVRQKRIYEANKGE